MKKPNKSWLPMVNILLVMVAVSAVTVIVTLSVLSGTGAPIDAGSAAETTAIDVATVRTIPGLEGLVAEYITTCLRFSFIENGEIIFVDVCPLSLSAEQQDIYNLHGTYPLPLQGKNFQYGWSVGEGESDRGLLTQQIIATLEAQTQ
ncbi:MAG: hypothetical protein GOV00_01940 [Candidatus Altiarchaeota archaeon]|nr:hypothetical protein [Candidatus Altiarchaeota archaeon]